MNRLLKCLILATFSTFLALFAYSAHSTKNASIYTIHLAPLTLLNRQVQPLLSPSLWMTFLIYIPACLM